MPAGQSERAMDSARIRCAALAGAKAAVLGIPRRDAVAPMKMILPAPARFMAGITCRATSRDSKALTRQAASNASGVISSIEPQEPEPGIVNKHIHLAELRPDTRKGVLDGSCIGYIALISPCIVELRRQGAAQ